MSIDIAEIDQRIGLIRDDLMKVSTASAAGAITLMIDSRMLARSHG